MTVDPRSLRTNFLAHAGRLLLEFNESTGEIHRALAAVAQVLADETCHVVVHYGGVAVSLAGEAPVSLTVRELRYNAAVQAQVHTILEQVRRGEIEVATALARLRTVEADTPRHSRWVAILALGVAATSLAALLGADVGTMAVAGLSTGLGLFARQELGRRHVSVLALPLAATFIGSTLGGLAIRLGWIHAPELVLLVPALMLVPGPHLINGVLDLFENHLPMSLARLGLAAGILLASAVGILFGFQFTVPGPLLPDHRVNADHINLVTDMVLAGVVTCGFAVFYNSPWRQVGMAVVGGMTGHGFRFLALEAGYLLETATFLGCIAVGVASNWMARSRKTPFAVIAFAGAVTMMPGLHIYRALGGAMKLAHQGSAATLPTLAGTLGNALQACLVVGGIAMGLVLGAWVVLGIARKPGETGPTGHGQSCVSTPGAET